MEGTPHLLRMLMFVYIRNVILIHSFLLLFVMSLCYFFHLST